MSIMGNIFSGPSSAEEKRVAAETAEKISLVSDMARACLATEQFGAYRKQYVAAEAKMVDEMLMITASFSAGSIDLTQYGAKMLVCLTRLKDLRMLIDTVDIGARKGDRK